MSAALVTIGCALLCGGPLLLTPVAILLMGIVTGTELGGGQVAVTIISLQLSAVLAVGMLYRWCFGRAPVRGAGLLAASAVSVLLMSHAPFLGLLGQMFAEPLHGPPLARFLGALIIDSLTLVGLTCCTCTLGVLLIELPLRWVQGEWPVVSEGAFRAARAILLLLIAVASSTVIRERGIVRLVDLVTRALA